MAKLIFLNIGIDQLWNKDHAIRSLSSFEDLTNRASPHIQQFYGVYFASDPEDTVVSFAIPDPAFLDYLKTEIGFVPRLVEVSVPARNAEEWRKQIDIKFKSIPLPTSFLFAGISICETHILNFFGESAELTANEQAYLNKKEYLVGLCAVEKIDFPETKMMESTDKLFDDRAFVIKLNQSAGSTGVFKIKNKDSKDLKLFRRFLSLGLRERILIQESLHTSAEYYLVATSENAKLEKIAAYELEIARDRETIHKRLDSNHPAIQPLTSAAEKISKHLIASGYFGPFGFDAIRTSKRLYPCIDLNVRFDRVAMIEQAAARFGIGGGDGLVSVRENFYSESRLDFSEFRKNLRSKLRSDLKFVYYQCVEQSENSFKIISHLILSNEDRQTLAGDLNLLKQFYAEKRNSKNIFHGAKEE